MRTSLRLSLSAAVTAVALSSCSVNPAAPLCNAVQLKNIATPQLIYPVPGYASVPSAATFIVVAYPGSPADAQTITLTVKGHSAVALGPMGAAPAQIPTPHAAVLPGQGVEYGVTLPTLMPHTTYTVNYRYASSGNLCGQTTTTNALMGNFTTSS